MKCLITLTALALTACATNQTPTFNQLVVTAASLDDAVLVTGNALLNSGVISAVQSKKILSITDNVTVLLTAANTAYVAGNTALANSQLSKATSTLTTTQACLSQQTGKPPIGSTVDACIAGVMP